MTPMELFVSCLIAVLVAFLADNALWGVAALGALCVNGGAFDDPGAGS